MPSTRIQRTAAPPARRRRRPLLLAAGVALGVLVLLLATAAGLRLARPGALPGTTVHGVDLGGLDGDPLRAAVLAAAPLDDAITVVREDARWQATGRELGYALDADATAERVLARGRQLNPLAALRDHLIAFGSAIAVEPVESVDAAVLTAQVEQAAAHLDLEPREGTVEVEGTAITRVDPRGGAAIDRTALGEQLRAALRTRGADVIPAPTTTLDPETTVADVDAAAARAAQVVSAPVELVRDDTTLTFSPEQLGDLLHVGRDGGDLDLFFRVSDVAAVVPEETVAALRSEPVDARFSISSGDVSIIDAVEGFAFDSEATAAQLLDLASGEGERRAELVGEVLEPARSTADAQALGITERVSTFTTEHACCEGRVTNIQRMADAVDGVVIEPGETFSLNDHVGPRTREKGYVGGGAIHRGEFVEQVGGGVSQFATTMFNAAYFGGYDIPEHKAHSYYISRYPVGREATLNHPTIDLKVRNSSPHGILVATAYTATSITVSFYGTTWVEVDSTTGPRRNITQPETRTQEGSGLPAGSTRVVQPGREGFDVTVVRTLRFPDGRSEREEQVTRYLPEPRIVERGPAAPPPPAPEPAPEPEAVTAPQEAADGGT